MSANPTGSKKEEVKKSSDEGEEKKKELEKVLSSSIEEVIQNNKADTVESDAFGDSHALEKTVTMTEKEKKRFEQRNSLDIDRLNKAKESLMINVEERKKASIPPSPLLLLNNDEIDEIYRKDLCPVVIILVGSVCLMSVLISILSLLYNLDAIRI